jgi:hypothetical protein
MSDPKPAFMNGFSLPDFWESVNESTARGEIKKHNELMLIALTSNGD